jgi:hypothetical protein
MERVIQPFNDSGVQIPGYLIKQFGYQPGTNVVIEIDTKGIHIVPALLNEGEIEKRAMAYAFKNIGDAVTVDVTKQPSNWHVTVYGAEELPESLGFLIYSENGELLQAESTPPEAMWEKAAALAATL